MMTDVLRMPAPSETQQSGEQSPAKNTLVEIAVISVTTAIERRRKIEAMFSGTGLSWSYFEAHTGLKQPSLTYSIAEVKRKFGRALSAPEIAVCSSHVGLLSEFLERESAEHLLVLEDDVIFDTEFPLDAFCTFCTENGIDYVRLFGKHYAPAIRLGFFYDRSIIRYTTSPAGAQAYLISRTGARKFLDSYRTIDATVDLAMDAFWSTQLPIYSIFPYPIIERYSPTSIPMPAYKKELSGLENLIWLCNRVIAKASKIYTNIRLRKIDHQMVQRPWRFRQIFDNKTS